MHGGFSGFDASAPAIPRGEPSAPLAIWRGSEGAEEGLSMFAITPFRVDCEATTRPDAPGTSVYVAGRFKYCQ